MAELANRLLAHHRGDYGAMFFDRLQVTCGLVGDIPIPLGVAQAPFVCEKLAANAIGPPHFFVDIDGSLSRDENWIDDSYWRVDPAHRRRVLAALHGSRPSIYVLFLRTHS